MWEMFLNTYLAPSRILLDFLLSISVPSSTLNEQIEQEAL